MLRARSLVCGSDASEKRHLPGKAKLSIVRLQGTGDIQKSVPHFQQRRDRLHDFLDRYCLHAAKVDGAFSQKTGTAFDLMANHATAVSGGAGETRFRRTKDSNH